MPGSAAKIHQPPFCKQENAMAIRERIHIHLWLDVRSLDAGSSVEPRHLNLMVKVADVAHNRLIFHVLHVLKRDHVHIAGASDVDITAPSVSSTVVTSYPCIAACSALIGSISVTITRAPMPRNDCAEPLPTSPYPQTTATLPAIITSVARLMPSTSDSRQPYKLSNFDLVTESFTLIAGTSSFPASCIL